VASVLERAERNGYRTGIVTTDRLTNPTVAAHYAHGEQMPDQKRRASAFAGLAGRVEGSDGIDLAYGGGAGAFDGSVLARLEGQGVDVGTTWDEGGARDRQVVRLLADGRLPGAAERGGDEGAGGVPSLEEMTRAAIERLADGERPFFLIVEADGMGRLQRAVDRSGAIAEEVAAFDRAVEAGLSFARRDKRTLVVATADRDYTMSVFDNHYGFNDRMCGIAKRCGGPMELIELPVAVEKLSKGLTDSSLQGQYAPPRLFVQYAWPVQAAHRSRKASGVASANFVPLFAEGPWAKRLEGGIDQREVGALLVDWADSQTIESTK
jgi:alkaline phosphatase